MAVKLDWVLCGQVGLQVGFLYTENINLFLQLQYPDKVQMFGLGSCHRLLGFYNSLLLENRGNAPHVRGLDAVEKYNFQEELMYSVAFSLIEISL